MNQRNRSAEPGDQPGRPEEGEAAPEPEPLHEYASGEITERRGIVNRWLLVVYFGLFVWALYYLFRYWGGLGPGLDY